MRAFVSGGWISRSVSLVLDLFTLKEEAGDNSKRTVGETFLRRSATVIAQSLSLSRLIDSKLATSVCTSVLAK
jgi:hypothetical protein